VAAKDTKRLVTMSLETNDRLEIERQELARSGLSDGFLRSGRTQACSRSRGKTPTLSERLKRWQITGATCTDRRFNSQMGMGSRSHDFDAELLSNAVISMTVTGARKAGCT
jgi:hypothetical protein